MRALVAYLFAVLAIATGVWFGFFAGDDAEGGSSRRAASASPVILAPVVEAPFADTIEALGTALANESVELRVNRSGLVQALHFDDGDTVKDQAPLLELDATEEQAMLAEANAMKVEREASHKRQVELRDQGIAPESEVVTALAQLEAARARVKTLEAAIRDHRVLAPFAGVLGLRQVSVGSLLQPATVITTLDDLSVVKVDFTIPETWLSAVRVGQPVLARSDAWRGQAFSGEIVAIDTRLDARTRSVTVRARVENPELRLRPGMLMKVQVDRGEAPSLQVPEESLIQRGKDHFVLVVDEQDVAHETQVQIGRRLVGRVEVLGGLVADQRVVVQGLVRVRDGSSVEVVGVRGGVAK
ncbi:MAG: efflux RND transporter periplasmic adaptor subunit [Planctomycetota bacterium]